MHAAYGMSCYVVSTALRAIGVCRVHQQKQGAYLVPPVIA